MGGPRPGRNGRHPTPASFDRVEAGVGGDAVQPGPQRRAALEAGPGAPRLGERLLHEVLGVLEVAEHAVAVHPQLAPVRLDQRRELRLVTPRTAATTAGASPTSLVVSMSGITR